jgi:hypothetical protein
MSERNEQLLHFYRQNRIDDNRKFYDVRRDQSDRVIGQGLLISAILLGLATAAGALSGTTVGWATGWSIIATILPAASTALTAYLALDDPEQQSKIYQDAGRAIRAAARSEQNPHFLPGGHPSEAEIAELVKRVEGALRQRHSQWGRLISLIPIADHTKD